MATTRDKILVKFTYHGPDMKFLPVRVPPRHLPERSAAERAELPDVRGSLAAIAEQGEEAETMPEMSVSLPKSRLRCLDIQFVVIGALGTGSGGRGGGNVVLLTVQYPDTKFLIDLRDQLRILLASHDMIEPKVDSRDLLLYDADGLHLPINASDDESERTSSQVTSNSKRNFHKSTSFRCREFQQRTR